MEKFRYVFQHTSTGNIIFKTLTLSEVEEGKLLDVKEGLRRYYLIGRNKYTVVEDINGNSIFEGDITIATVNDTYHEWGGKQRETMNPLFEKVHEVKFYLENTHSYYSYAHNEFLLTNYDNIGIEKYNLCGKHGCDCILCPSIVREHGIKIIGNMYENNELLTLNKEERKTLLAGRQPVKD
jgi:hypothetical protein